MSHFSFHVRILGSLRPVLRRTAWQSLGRNIPKALHILVTVSGILPVKPALNALKLHLKASAASSMAFCLWGFGPREGCLTSAPLQVLPKMLKKNLDNYKSLMKIAVDHEIFTNKFEQKCNKKGAIRWQIN